MKTKKEIIQKSIELRQRMYDSETTKVQALVLKELDEVLRWVIE
jgi:hypothetical protein